MFVWDLGNMGVICCSHPIFLILMVPFLYRLGKYSIKIFFITCKLIALFHI